jgi:hypothetical protein
MLPSDVLSGVKISLLMAEAVAIKTAKKKKKICKK